MVRRFLPLCGVSVAERTGSHKPAGERVVVTRSGTESFASAGDTAYWRSSRAPEPAVGPAVPLARAPPDGAPETRWQAEAPACVVAGDIRRLAR